MLALYRQSYNANSSKIEPNDVFAKVHELILEQDSKVLLTSVEYINFMHKKGLLHQLANRLDKNVIWSDLVSLEDVTSKM
ncbi:hypothetical protein D3C84_1108640 [compost metagenome]